MFVIDDDADGESAPDHRRAAHVGDLTTIDKGVKPGEQVVIDGQSRLTPNAQVDVKLSRHRYLAPRTSRSGTRRQLLEARTMNFSELFIRRPVMTTLVMVGILFFGITAYRQLPVSDLPTVDYPDDHGEREPAGREPGDDGVRRRDAAREAVLDDRRHRQHDVDVEPRARRRSRCSSRSTATSTPPRRTCRRRSPRRCAHLPPGIIPPSYQKANPADQPILFFALTSDAMPLSQLDEYAETLMAQRISMVRGRRAGERVRLAEVRGAHPARPERARAAAQIGIDEVADAISAQNVNLPTGVLWGPTQGVHACRRTASSSNAAAFRRLVVAYRNGAPVRLGDLGHVLDDVQNNRQARAGSTARAAIILAIQRQPGTNTVAGRRRRQGARCRSCATQLPAACSSTLLIDRVAGDPRVGARREVHAGADAGARRRS